MNQPLVNQKRFQDISTQDFLTPSFSTPDFLTLLILGLKLGVEYSGVEMSCNLQKNAKMIGDPHEDFDLAQLVAALPEQYGNMSFQVSKRGIQNQIDFWPKIYILKRNYYAL